ncbi:MAG: hypothetical protein CMF31_09635 [Kordiimonas sp.]|mgnify:CR=1 FL=1|nr:hypothetical protein [Kordiimonas sp.]|tara:strand:+ start:651 stop:1286 length:636 start_codon:yes stop_codon:yes gene_type:complete
MSENAQQDEPTMEEILASIRKIISEDDEEGEKRTAEPEESSAEDAVPEPVVDTTSETESTEAENDDVLELTDDMTEELDEFEENVSAMAPEAEDTQIEEEEVPPSEPEEPEPLPDVKPADHTDFNSIDDVDPAEGNDVLMSDAQASAAMAQFGFLSDVLTKGYEGSENTLEALVRELLKPMLKSWLDENLPPIVERMVAKEIARLARTKQK